MAAYLGKVITRVGIRPGVEHDHGLVYDTTPLIPDQGIVLPVRFEAGPGAYTGDNVEGIRPADADDTDSAAAPWCGLGIDGIFFYRDVFLGTMTTFLYTPSPMLLVFKPFSFFRARWMIRRS